MRPVVVGHRGMGLPTTNLDVGARNGLIGNTAHAISNAIRAKADWIEIDIRQSADGKLVVFHDAELDAKTNLKGAVKSKTLQELQSCNLSVDPPEPILSLQDVFGNKQFQTEKHNWILDIKVQGIADDVIQQLDRSAIPKNQIIVFADFEVLREYKGKGLRLGYTTLFQTHPTMLFSAADVFRRCKEIGCDLLVVPIVFVTPSFLDNANELGMDVWSYGSSDPRDLRYCAECGVKGIVVDTPAEAVSQFANMYKER